MKRSLRAITALAALALTGCGTSGTNPLRPREADFRVMAPSGTPYNVVMFQASNGPEHYPPPEDLTAPHIFVFLNAGSSNPTTPGVPPAPVVTGVFQGVTAALDDVNIELRLGFVDSSSSVVATTTIPAGSDAVTTIGTEGTPEPDNSIPETRFEVTANDPQGNVATDVEFAISIGDADSTFLPCGDSAICHAPVTFYFENPKTSISATINKINQDDRSLTMNLYIADQLRGGVTVTASEPTGNVQADL
jgi:hypothetical protein